MAEVEGVDAPRARAVLPAADLPLELVRPPPPGRASRGTRPGRELSRGSLVRGSSGRAGGTEARAESAPPGGGLAPPLRRGRARPGLVVPRLGQGRRHG